MALSLKLSPRSTLKFKTATKIPAQLLGGDGVSVAYANGAYTISFDFDNFDISALGLGTISVQDADAVALTGTFSLAKAQNTVTAADVSNTSTGSNALAVVRFTTDAGANIGSVGAAGSNYTLIPVLQNRLFMYAGAATSGIAINTANASDSVDIGIADTRVARFLDTTVLALTPALNTYNKGLSITQSGPTTSSGQLAYNTIHVDHQGTLPSTGFDAYGNVNNLGTALRVSLSVSNVNRTGQLAVAAFTAKDTTDNPNAAGLGDLLGSGSTVYITTQGTIGSPAGGYGSVSYAIADGTARRDVMVGHEADIGIASTATINARFGLRVVASPIVSGATPGRGAVSDAAIAVANLSANEGAFDHLIYVQQGGFFPNRALQQTGSVLKFQAATTLAKVFDLSNVTVSDKIIDHINFTVTGAGVATLGASLTLVSTNAGAGDGPNLLLYRNSATPAASDSLGTVEFQGEDSAGNTETYARTIGVISDPTSGSEKGLFVVQTVVNGSLGNRGIWYDGLQLGAPTGGDKGAGTLNTAGAIYQNNVAVPTISSTDTLSNKTFPNTGLRVLDTNASHGLILAPGSDLTADRTLTITTGDAARTLDISAASVAVSSFAATVLDDTTAAAMATTAGLVRVVKKQSFTASGTYTPSTGMLYCIIRAWGGGGGGGGAASGAGNSGAGGGGGAGGYSEKTASAANIGASQTVTIGAAGAAGAAGNNAGGNGGDTSVGSLCIGKGGSGGSGGPAGGSSTSGAGGVAGTGDAPLGVGMSGYPGAQFGTVYRYIPGAGGSASPVGSGGHTPTGATTTTGAAATGYASGGGGGGSFNATGDAAGGAGTAGLVVITEYCTQ